MEKNKIDQVTVADLAYALVQEIKKGNGNKYLVVPDDNEGNGYHGIYYHVSQAEPCIADMLNDSQITDTNNLMIIG